MRITIIGWALVIRLWVNESRGMQVASCESIFAVKTNVLFMPFMSTAPLQIFVHHGQHLYSKFILPDFLSQFEHIESQSRSQDDGQTAKSDGHVDCNTPTATPCGTPDFLE